MKSRAVLKEEEKIKQAQEAEGSYTPSEDEKAIIDRVYQRYSWMKSSEARTNYETDIDEADKDYRGYVVPNDPDDYRSNINKPISFAIIETMEQETIERKPRPYVEPRSKSDEVSASFTNDVLKYSFDVGNFDLQYALARKESRIRGTGFLFEYYRLDKRSVGELDIKKGEEGDYEEQYKLVEKVDYDDLYCEHLDGQWLFFDPAANHISKAKDMIRREILNHDEFYRVYGNKRGFINVDMVKGSGSVDWSTFYTPTEGMEEDGVEVLHYYNRSLDRYDVVANGVVIRKGYNPYPHKELPAIPIYCYKDPNHFYGLGIPKIVKSLVEERNTISNLRMDAQKMGINKMFFIDDMVELDDIDLIPRPHGFIPVNTGGQPLGQKILPLEYGNIPLSTYKEEEVLIEDIRRTTGVDDRIQGLNMGGTATEASILKEATMKRINAQNLYNEMDALVRLGQLRLENIKLFYSVPKFEKITGKDDVKEKYRTIAVKGKEYKIDQQGALIVEDTEGVTNFTLNKDFMKFMERDYDIVVKADASYVVSKPVMQSKYTEMVDRITANPLFQLEADPKKLLKRYLEIMDEEPEKIMKEPRDTEEMQFLAQMENDVMMAGYPIPPTDGATMEHNQVHLNYAQSAEAQENDPILMQILETHIKGEAMAMGAIGGAQPNMASQMPSPNVNPVDIMPNNPQGAE